MNERAKMSGVTNNQWEVSKENFPPNQQAKTKLSKVALSSHLEEVTLQQQSYESNLRLCNGKDLLPLCYEYIKWMEQNLPKCSCEKQSKELIERYLPVLISETKYFDDNRFVNILIKYAILSCKPMEVYKYMHGKGIGHSSAKFYITWSQEVEKHGNLKQADEILLEGLKCRAAPFEKLLSYYEDFKLKISNKLKDSSEKLLFGPKNSQPSLDALTPKMKRFATNSKDEEASIENKEFSLLIGKQPHQKSITTSVKIPFKIHDLENINPSVHLTTSGNLKNYESSAEKKQISSRLNAIKSINQFDKPSVTKQAFDFYCDVPCSQDFNSHTSKSVFKASNILNSDSENFCPPIALFEPPDPYKKPMYPKNKVYAGAEEFSLEEIRATEWIEKKKKREQEVHLIELQKTMEEQKKTEEELKKQVNYLTKQVELLQTQLRQSGISSSKIFDISFSNSNYDMKNFPPSNHKLHENSHFEKSVTERNSVLSEHCMLPDNVNSHSQQDIVNDFSGQNKLSDLSNLPNLSQNNTDFTGRTEAVRMVQELFNKTLNNPDILNESKHSACRDISGKSFLIPSVSDSNENFQPDAQNCSSKLPQGNLQFSFYCDPTATITSMKTSPTIEEVKKDNFLEITSEDDVENIPPEGYIQEKSKRELAGILQASKNIVFIPLEEQQEESSDECSDMEGSEICYSKRQFSDDTLIPPSSTEQFSTAKFLSSTPFVPRNNSPSLEISDHKIVPLEEDSTVNHLSSSVSQHSAKKGLENDHAISELKSFNDQSCAPRLSKMLSVIMETSREAYSKSSSSSSSSLTRSNNLEQLSSNRVSMFKPYSKFEPSTLSSVLEIPSDNSNTVCEKNSGIMQKEQHQKFPIHITDIDPFDQNLNQAFLNSINVSNYENLNYIGKSLKGLKSGEIISIGNRSFQIMSFITEGAYAKVYVANDCALIAKNDGLKFALKVCKNTNEWEFYICSELQKRLKDTSFRNSVMQIISAAKYSNAIVLVSEYSLLGTLLDVINFYKKDKAGMPEFIVMYFTREILLIVSELHEHGIIHGDIKSDNFLLTNDAFKKNSLDKLAEGTSLQLIDFGRAIDLNCYNKGVCFTSVLTKAHFKCNEMKENKPWVFQLDWYGVASCIHTMLFSDYMTVKKKDNGWEIEKKLKRYWCTSLWDGIFHDLLNIPECYQELNVKSHIGKIESKLQQNSNRFFNQFCRFATLYNTRN